MSKQLRLKKYNHSVIHYIWYSTYFASVTLILFLHLCIVLSFWFIFLIYDEATKSLICLEAYLTSYMRTAALHNLSRLHLKWQFKHHQLNYSKNDHLLPKLSCSFKLMSWSCPPSKNHHLWKKSQQSSF